VKHTAALQRILAVSLFLILPFLFTAKTLDPVLVPRFLFVSGTVLLWTIATLVRNEGPITRLSWEFMRPDVALLATFVLIQLLSIAWAANVQEAAFEVCRAFTYLVLLILLKKLLAEDQSSWISLFKTVCMTALILSTIGILQYFRIVFIWLPGNVIPYATMANKNLLSSILLLSLPCAGVISLTAHRVWRVVSLLSIVLSLYTLCIGQTRSVWLALLAAILAGVVSNINVRIEAGQEYRRRLRRLAAVSALAFVASVGTMTSYHRADSDHMLSGVNLSSASMNERFALWEKTLGMIADNPLLGVGAGNWKFEIPLYGTEGLPTSEGSVFFQRPHNDYLWILSETGPLGLLAYIGFIGMIFLAALRLIRKTGDQRKRIVSTAMVFGVVAFAVVSFFSYPKERVAHMCYLILMSAVVFRGPTPRTVLRDSFLSRVWAKIWAVIAIAGLLCCIVIGVARLSAEIHAKKALLARENSQWRTVANEISSVNLNLVNVDPTSTPLEWYQGVAHFSLQQYDSALVDFRAAFEANPNHIHVLNNLGTCYEAMGEHDSAIAYYEKALRIIPDFEESLLNLAAAYYNAHLYDQAMETLQRFESPPRATRYDSYFRAIESKLHERDSLR
jgi:O-antigen ligase